MPLRTCIRLVVFLTLTALPALSQTTCSFSLDPASANFASAGGTGVVVITANLSSCPRTSSSSLSWVHIGYGQTGTGSGSVGYTVDPNNSSGPRSGSITVANRSFTVTQAADSSCTYTLSPAFANIAASGGSGPISVSSSCSWTAASNNSDWLTAAGSANGDGVAQYSAAPNATGASRTGSITIGTASFAVAQAAPCAYTLNPTNLPAVPASGSTGTFTVTATSNTCSWTAVSANANFLTVTSGASGTGNGTVGFTILSNQTTFARSGAITVGGSALFNVYQLAGAPCSTELMPTSAAFPTAGGANTFNITTNCAWTATTNAPWINLSGAISGTGNGALAFNVGANSGAARTGAITVGSQTFTVSQSGAAAVQVASGGVVNGASFLPGPVAPGEIITIFGTGLGPQAGTPLQLSADQQTITTMLAGTEVLFDGTPAPLIYVSSGQVSTIVPYALGGKTSTQMQVQYQGALSSPVTLSVSATSPALFSLAGSGKGPGAILNQDGSLNSTANPAQKGSVVVLFATGEGKTNPPGVDGLLANSPTLPSPVAPITVQIGGANATLLYAGAAPGETAGVLQVNVQIPANTPSGPVPVVLQAGTALSPSTVTVAVQ